MNVLMASVGQSSTYAVFQTTELKVSFSIFLEGIENFGLPLRVRCHHGMENILVARFMLERRGLNGIITGVSVHIQRIERLWAELNRVVSRHYINIFNFMEDQGILDSLNELHLFCLHYVFFFFF